MRLLLPSIAALLLASVPDRAAAQIPTKCLEIESILVDACNPASLCGNSPEPRNEMVRFRTGPDAIALGEIDVDWPNNSWQGLVQNATTADVTAQLNATIESCGQLLEPPGGVIPPGSPVILVTSTEMCVEGNSFAGLADQVYIVFQNPSGTTAGHFKNYDYQAGDPVSPVPFGSGGFRSLRMYVGAAHTCGDTATYDYYLLTNVMGTYGGTTEQNDGATVEFSWPGAPVATYVNHGCQAPIIPFTVEAEVDGDLCSGGTVNVAGIITGSYDELTWSGGTGTFADPTALNTTYTAGPGETGDVQLQLCATGTCSEPLCATVTVPAGDAPDVEITADGPLTLCGGDALVLTASGAEDYAWNTFEGTASITVDEPGTYSVTGSNACGQATASVTVVEGQAPVAAITGDLVLCPGETTVLTATGGPGYSWSSGPTTASITVSTPGTYTVIVDNGCGTSTAQVVVTQVQLPATFSASPLTGEAPLDVAFTPTTLPPGSTQDWDFGDGDGSSDPAPGHTFTQPGVYTVTHTVTGQGCSVQSTVTITVLQVVVESHIEVPNVFTPNGDATNAFLQVLAVGIVSMDMDIYSRWGQRVAHLGNVYQVWSGRSEGSGEPVPEGTYFYTLHAVGGDGKAHDLHGTVTVLR
jgi:gliding motility-associated-like protein